MKAAYLLPIKRAKGSQRERGSSLADEIVPVGTLLVKMLRAAASGTFWHINVISPRCEV